MGVIVTAFVLVVVVLIALFLRYILLVKKAAELADKTNFAVENEDLMKISFEGNSTLKEISANFNHLVEKYLNVRGQGSQLETQRAEKDKITEKLSEFEHHLSQSNLLIDIGRKITSSLNVNEILIVVQEFVQSSMDIEEIELLFIRNEKTIALGIDKKGKIVTYTIDEMAVIGDAMQWVLDNNKVVHLNDAVQDYAQYFFKPLQTLSGKDPAALIVLPLFLNDKPIGVFGTYSLHKNVYTSYHIDFLNSIASYLAVALDNANVYQLLEKSKSEIENEKAKSDNLLLNILPAEIAEELKEKGEAPARHYDSVSILFTDFKEFTQAAEQLSATELVNEINTCFKTFESICEKYRVEKIKTIGDSYMAVGGLPLPYEGHIANTVKAGIEMAEFIIDRKKLNKNKVAFDMRLGIHCGPAVAGIVGAKKFQYDLWGDSVNTASRMESHGEIKRVNISEAIYQNIKNDPYFEFEKRGEIQVKGKGDIEMYFVNRSFSGG
jgi:class 3 adenylate cyclase